MNKLASFRKNPFLTINIAREKFEKFVREHIARTKSAHNPAFDSIILATETLSNSVFDNLQNNDEFKNQKRGLTWQVNKKIREFKALVLKMGSLVEVTFEKKSPTYEVFYPHGRTEYHRANKTNILVLFERIIEATTAYEAELGSDWKTAFSQMYADFVPLFQQQNQKKGEVAKTSSDFGELKKAMCNQLYKNLLVILAEYYENPKRAKTFFNEKTVNWKKPKKKKKKAKKVQEAVVKE